MGNRLLHLLILALIVVAFVSPWAPTGDGVPPPEFCDERFVLVNGNRCVRMMPGIEVLSMAGWFLGGIPDAVATRQVDGQTLRELAIVTFMLILLLLLALPAVSTLLSLWNPASRRARIFDTVAWGLVLPIGMFLALGANPVPARLVWGLWLYIALAAAAILLNIATGKLMRGFHLSGSQAT